MKTGHVYRIIRRDLNLAYVGQSQNYKRRIYQHRVHGRAEIKKLWADCDPELSITGPLDVGPELDQLEQYVMNDLEAQGFKLINVLRGQRWDSFEVRHAAARLGGMRGGAKNAATGHIQRIQKIGCKLGGQSAWKNPDRDKTHSRSLWTYRTPEQMSLDGLAGITKAMELHPEIFMETRTANGYKMGPVNTTKRRQCLECGRISNQPALGMHQKHSGHVGFRDLSSSPETPTDPPM